LPNCDADLLARIPLSARTILHVGCRDDALAAAYRPLNPKARILGLFAGTPPDERGAFDEAAGGPLDTVPFGAAGGIDCIIYDELLEHLSDPLPMLCRHAEALSPAGTLVVRSANRHHWRAAAAFLCGASLPEPALDQAALSDLLRRAGLSLAPVFSQEADPAGATRFFDALSPALSSLGMDANAFRARCSGSHLILQATKVPIRPLHVAGTMLRPVGGVSHVRVVHPLHALASDPSVTTQVTDRVRSPSLAEQGGPRVFILHRPVLAGEQGARIITALAEAGYMIVTEFDDHPDHFQMMRAGGELTFTGVHAVQTSTPYLAEELRRYNDEVAVFPNAIVALPEVRNFADPDTLTFFFGALNREAEWVPYIPALNDVAALAGSRLRFQVVHDHQFFQALNTPHKAFTPTCDYDTYQALLSSSEISFMPLSDTPFNRAKSDLKFIEAASYRVVSLASPIVYKDSIVHDETGILFDGPEELCLALLRLIALPALARRMAEQAREYAVRERMLAYQVSPRIAWYRSLWERRHELEQARRMRLARYAGLAA
jgi:hypothetical protein